MQGHQYITHEWLAQVIFYVIYLLSGINGLVIFRTIIIALPFIIFHLFLKKEGISFPLIVIILSFCLFVVTTRSFVRPHIFTYLFLSLVLYILYRYRSGSLKRLYALPIIFLLWSNIHSGILFGLLVLTVFTIVEWFKYLLRKVDFFTERGVMDRARLIKLSVYSLISLGASFINPHFHKALFYPFYLISAESYMITIRELMHTPLSDVYQGALFVYFFWGIIVWGAIAFLLNIKRMDFVNLFLFAITLFLSFKAGRNTVIFAILSVPILAYETNFFFDNLQKKRKKSKKKKDVTKRYFNYGVLIMNIVLTFVLIFSSYHFYTSGMSLGQENIRRFSLGIYPGIFPESACDFIEMEKIDGKMFNSFNEGGYITWRLYPEEQHFIDSRLLVFEDLYPEYIDVYWTHSGFEDILERYEIDYFLIYYPPQDSGDSYEKTIHSYLFKKDEWKLVFWDDASLVYLKDIPKFKELIDRYEYSAYNPASRSIEDTRRYFTANPDEVEREVLRAIEESPHSCYANMVMGFISELKGDWSSAEKFYQDASGIDEYNHQPHQRLGTVYRRQKKLDKALASFKRAREISPHNATIFNDLGITYAMMEDYDKAREMWEKSHQIDPDYVPTINNLRKLENMGY